MSRGFVTSSVPTARLNTICSYRHASGSWRHYEIDRDHAVLFAAANHVAGLNVDVLIREVSDREFIHVFSFIHPHLFLGQCFLKGEKCFVGLIFSVDEKDREVFVGVRPGEPVLGSV